MKLGSRVLVIDLRSNCCIGPYLCRSLVDLGFSIRCLRIIPADHSVKKADCDATTPFDQECLSSRIYDQYRLILGQQRFSEVEFRSVLLPSLIINNTFYKRFNRTPTFDDSTNKILKNSLLYMCQQISRIFLVFGNEKCYVRGEAHCVNYWILIQLILDVLNSHKGIINPIMLRSDSSSLSDLRVPISIICPSMSDSTQPNENGSTTLAKNDLEIQMADHVLVIVIQHCCLLISSTLEGQKLLNSERTVEMLLLDQWFADGAGVSQIQEHINEGETDENSDWIDSMGTIKRCIMVEDFCELILLEVERAVNSVALDKTLVTYEINGANPTDQESNSIMMNVDEFRDKLSGLASQLFTEYKCATSIPPSEGKRLGLLQSLMSGVCCRRRQWWNNDSSLLPSSNINSQLLILQFITENGSIRSSSAKHFSAWTKLCLSRGFARLMETSRTGRSQGTADYNRATKRRLNRNTIQFPLFRTVDENDVPHLVDSQINSTAVLKGGRFPTPPTLSVSVRFFLCSLPRLIGSISCFVCILEFMLLLECLAELLGMKRSIKVFSCLTGRTCPKVDAMWRKYGVGSSWCKLWNSIMRISVTAHIMYLMLLLWSSAVLQ